ncbi:MAG: ring-cleaving dioxygenase [Balneolaceae bacterium]
MAGKQKEDHSMASKIKGLHHITAVSGPPQKNYHFYHDRLGLRLTKKTINFDDPFTYHLYYGNYYGAPGSSITFFPWQYVGKGSPSTGEATVVQYAIPADSLSFWEERFREGDVIEKKYRLFDNSVISLFDNDGMKIELVETPGSENVDTKGEGEIPDQHAIRGFFGTTLSLADTGPTAELLEEFGWKSAGEEMGSLRYTSTPENHLGGVVDLRKEPDLNGTFGRGSIHHIAFRVPDDDAQAEWREILLKMGYQVTPVQNRDYFRSIYFREHGGVLFELATDIPGFTKDEPLEELGKNLKIPSWFEKHRDEIEARLPKLKT